MPSEVWSLVLDPRRIKPSVLPPSYFLVDGDDWLAHILSKKNARNNADMDFLDFIVRKLHGELNGMGIQPIVFLERGAPRSMKNAKHSSTPSVSSVSSLSHDSSEILKLQLLQLRKTLKSLTVDIEECDSVRRAGTMVEFYKGLKSREEYSCYIYGSALLDLWAAKGISFILFDTLSISDTGNEVQAPVWNKSIVATELFVNEKQLGELLILVGNKYTSPFGRRGFRSVTNTAVPQSFLELEGDESFGGKSKNNDRELKADNMISLAAMRDWILKQGSSVSLKFQERTSKPAILSPFTSAEKAIEYSRVYYDGGNIQKYLDQLDIDMNAMAAMAAMAAKAESTKLETKSINAAAAIMAAISGPGSGAGFGFNVISGSGPSFGKNAALSLKEPEKVREVVKEAREVKEVVEKVEKKAKNTKKVEDTKASSFMKFDLKEEREEKDMKEVSKDGEQKKGKKEPAAEKVMEKTDKTDKGGKKEKKESAVEVIKTRTVVISPRATVSASSATTTATTATTAAAAINQSTTAVSVDEDKGAQLRNLLGLKFGVSSLNKSFSSTATSITALPKTLVAALTPTVPSVPPGMTPSLLSPAGKASPHTEIDLPFSMKEPRGGKEKIWAEKIASTVEVTVTAATADADIPPVPPAARVPEVTVTSLAMAAVSSRLAEAKVRALAALAAPTSSPNRSKPLPKPTAELPIDAHKEKILEHVAKHRVTIIHGMTGCGKSSRYVHQYLRHMR